MDFAYSEDQQAVSDLARQILRDAVTDDYHARRDSELRAARGPQAIAVMDSALWQVLGDAGLIAAGMDEASGGSGLGFIAQCLVLQELGAVLAPVPLLPTALAAWALEQGQAAADLEQVAAGRQHLALSLEPGLVLRDAHLEGTLSQVRYAAGAQWVVARVGEQVVAFELTQPGIELTPLAITNGEPCSRIEITSADCEVLGAAPLSIALEQRLQVATAAIQLGVADEALRRTARYTLEREQFGRPLAAFQSVAHRAADGYIDLAALRSVVDAAMWRLHEGLDASLESAAARWWACETSHRVAHSAQHLHGGIGADLDYPIHRYFLWAKQLEFELPAAAHQLAAMGQYLAANNDSGVKV